MQVCQHCKGPIPEEARADAVYCSTSCKLKAQRQRKKDAVATPPIAARTEPSRSPVVAPPADAKSQPTRHPEPEPAPVLSLQPEAVSTTPTAPPSISTLPIVATPKPTSAPVASPQTLPLRTATPAAPHGEAKTEGRLIQQSACGSIAPPAEAAHSTQPENTSSATITAQLPTKSAQAPSVKATPAQTPPDPKRQSLGSEIATSLFTMFEVFATYKRQTEHEAAQKRAKETPEERQKREALDEKARRRLKKFDRFF